MKGRPRDQENARLAYTSPVHPTMEPKPHNRDGAASVDSGANLATIRPYHASDALDRSEGSSDNEDEEDKKLGPVEDHVPQHDEETEFFDEAAAQSQHEPSHPSLPTAVESGGARRKRSEESASSLTPPTKRSATLPEVTKEEHAASSATPSTSWDHAAHRSFCSALFEIGLSHASPSVLLESMEHRNEACITSERIKSHLQKYRKNKQKSADEFWAQYDAFLSIASSSSSSNTSAADDLSSLATAVAQSGNVRHGGPLRGGHTAAFLTAAVRIADTAPAAPPQQHPPVLHPWTMMDSDRGVVLPALTEQEQNSPLGQSIRQTFGLFQSVSRHILQQRMIGHHEDNNNSSPLIDDATGLNDDTEWQTREM